MRENLEKTESIGVKIRDKGEQKAKRQWVDTENDMCFAHLHLQVQFFFSAFTCFSL